MPSIYSAGSASVQIVPDFEKGQEAIKAWFASQGDMHIRVVPDLTAGDLERIRLELQAVQAEIRPQLSAVDTAAAQAALNGLSAEVNPDLASTAAVEAQLNSLEGFATIHVLLDAASMERVQAQLDGLEGHATIHVDADTSAARTAIDSAGAAAAGGAAGRAAGGGGDGGGGGTGAFLGAAALGPIGAVTAGAAALNPFGGGGPTAHLALHAIPLIGDMLPSLGALALAPALITSVGASAVVTKLALDNMSVAFKGLSDNATPAQLKAAQEAIAAMPPAAREFVTTLAPMQAQIDTQLVKPIQQAFFQNLGPGIKALATEALPLVQKGMVSVAQSTNQSLLMVIHQLMADSTQFGTIWDNIDKARATSIPVLSTLLQIFVQFTAVGSQFLPAMAQHTTELTQRWLDWTNQAAATGKLFNIIQTGLTTLHEMAQLVGNLGRILVDLFTAAQIPGLNMLQLLVQLTGALAAFLKAPPGADALRAIFTALHTETNALVPLIGDFIQRVILAAGHIISDLQPALVVFFNGLTSIYHALTPLWDALLRLLDAVLPPLVKIFDALVPPLVAFAVEIGHAAATVVTALTPALTWIANFLVATLIPVINFLGPALGPIVLAIIAWTQAQKLLNLAFDVAKFVTWVVQVGLVGGVMKVVELATKAWAAAQWLVNAAMDANPIGLVIVGLALLGAAIYLLVTHWTEVTGFLRDRWNSAWAYITSTASAAWGAVVSAWNTFTGFLESRWNSAWAYITGVLSSVGGALASAWGAVTGALTSAWNTVTGFLESRWNSAWAYISGIATTAWGAISGFFTGAFNAFVGFFQGIWDGLSNYFVTLWDVRFRQPVEAIWGVISVFFANAWAAFTNVFQTAWNAIAGFFTTIWNGISSFAQTIWNAISGFFARAWAAETAAWSAFWSAISSFFQTIWNGISSFAQTIWNAIAGFFTRAWATFTSLWNTFWSSISSFFSTIWNGISSTAQQIWGAISGFFTGAWRDFTNAWNGFWDGVGRKFSDIWNGIRDFARTVWEDIKAVIEAPIKFVVGTVLDNGLFKAWNAVNDFLLLPWHINPLLPTLGFSEGGYTGDKGLYGTGAREDPAGLVHAGEFVHTQEKTKQWLPLFQLIHQGMLQPSDLNLPGFAGGGLASTPQSQWTWPELDHIRQVMFPGSVLTDAYRPGANDYHGAGQAIDIGWAGNDPAHLASIAAALAKAYPGMTEGIHNPNLSIKNGQVVPPSFWGAATWAAHANHVHWAETPQALGAGNLNPGGVNLLTVAGQVISSVTDALGALTGSITGPIGSLFSTLGKSKWVQILAALPKKLLDGLWGKVSGAVGGALSALLSSSVPNATFNGAPAAPAGNAGGIQAQVQQQMVPFGWGSGAEWDALVKVITRESGWNPGAQNPTSSASGLGQFITSTWDAYRPGSANGYPFMKNAPVNMQASAIANYIGSVYHDPIGAWNSELRRGWYDTGGVVPPGWNTLYNGTGRPEVMLNPPQIDRLNTILDGRSGNGQLLRDMTVNMHTANPYEMADEVVHRLRVAARGGVFSTT